MGQTVWTESVCDRCGKVEREVGIHELFRLPNGWSQSNTIRYYANEDHQSSIVSLCSRCKDAFNEWMELTKDVVRSTAHLSTVGGQVKE